MSGLLSFISWQFLLFVLIFLIWTAILIFLDKKKILKRYNMDRIWFMALMWRTKKGRGLIDRIASIKKFWLWVSTGGFVLFFTGMIFMFVLVALSAYVASTSPLVEPVGASEVLVLPGINPYVPFIYGLIGLIIAVVAHEFSHGIIARVMGFKVKALGLLFIIIPMGAFMEPDEKEVEKGPRISRMRMFSAGPVMNFLLAFIFILIFSGVMMNSIEASGDPLIITDVSTDSPFHLSVEDHPKALYSINGTDISSLRDLYEYGEADPGTWIYCDMKMDGGRYRVPMISGIMITGVGDDTPAEETGMIEGSIIYSLNGTPVKSSQQFSDLMDDTIAEQIIQLVLFVPQRDDSDEIILNRSIPEDILEGGMPYADMETYPHLSEIPHYQVVSYNVTLDNKFDYYKMNEFKGKGYIGITSSYMGVSGIGSDEFLEILRHPLLSGNGFRGKVGNLVYITFRLPLELEKMPFHDPLTDIYEIKGPLSIIPEPAFWFITNTIFYTFWLNILLGLFNALPMVPLDGGFVFRDTVVLLIKKGIAAVNRLFPERKFRFIKNDDEENLEKIAKNISITASLLVLGMIIMSLLGPRIQLLF